MGLGNRAPRNYFKIKNGKIVITINAGQRENFSNLEAQASNVLEYQSDKGVALIDYCYDWYEGYLQDIKVIEREFNGSKVKSWQIIFATPETGEIFIWDTYYDGYLIQNFVNCLSSIPGKIGIIRLSPWMGKDQKGNPQTKLTFYHNGNSQSDKLGWKFKPEELPKIQPVKGGDGNDFIDAKGNKVYDTKKRMLWLVNEIQSILKKLDSQGIKPPTNGVPTTNEHYIDEPNEVEDPAF